MSRRFSVTARFYRTCVLDGIVEHPPAEHVRRPRSPGRITDPGVHACSSSRPAITEPLRPRPPEPVPPPQLRPRRLHGLRHMYQTASPRLKLRETPFIADERALCSRLSMRCTYLCTALDIVGCCSGASILPGLPYRSPPNICVDEIGGLCGFASGESGQLIAHSVDAAPSDGGFLEGVAHPVQAKSDALFSSVAAGCRVHPDRVDPGLRGHGLAIGWPERHVSNERSQGRGGAVAARSLSVALTIGQQISTVSESGGPPIRI